MLLNAITNVLGKAVKARRKNSNLVDLVLVLSLLPSFLKQQCQELMVLLRHIYRHLVPPLEG